jgi:predicted ArsR family transcriptional regulator
MGLAILLLLQQHAGSLAAEQIAAHLGDPLDKVNAALRQLRDRGAVDVLAVGEIEGHATPAASYWRLTEQGRDELARLR